MKTTRPSPASRAARQRNDDAKQVYEPVLRACEAAATRLKTASDELAQSWTVLCREITTGISATELLRKRAWCNVLELRLKEHAYALEQARHAVDQVWEDLMLTARARELFNRFLRKNAAEAGAESNMPLLARTASVLAVAHQRSLSAKK
jgi:flagellar biosynthesis chaperone FliJ